MASPEFRAKVVASVTTCTKQYHANLKDIVAMMRQRKLPEIKEQKCIVGCFYKEMGYLTDNKVDWKKFKALNPQKYDTPELIKKVDQVTDTCAKVETKKSNDICELGVPETKCFWDGLTKLKMPNPYDKIDI